MDKKWMVVMTEEQYKWISDMGSKADVSGAAVLRALITQAMNDNSEKFRRSLVNAQLQEEIDALEAKKHKIAEQERELRAKLSTREATRERVLA